MCIGVVVFKNTSMYRNRFRPVKVGETTRDIQEIRRKIDQVDDDDFISALRNGHSDRVFLLQMRYIYVTLYTDINH